LNKIDEPPLPRMSFSQLTCNDLPPDWVQVSPHWHPPEVVRGWSYRLGFEMVRSAWTRGVISDSDAEKKWMAELDEGASPWGLRNAWRSFKCSLLRMSRRQVWRWICLPHERLSGQEIELLLARRRFSRGGGVWMPLHGPVSCDNGEAHLDASSSRGEGDICPICMDGRATARTSCGHDFCHACLGEWLSESKSCPVCRSDSPSFRGVLSSGPPSLQGVTVVCDLTEDDYY